MPQTFTESIVEQAALNWLGELGYEIASGLVLIDTERGGNVALEGRLRQALARLRQARPNNHCGDESEPQ